ncbi:MAG: KpsF/GutQ family sugar-phosphate isomerase [Cypionkella sp.]|nr:KpsF/GutQ family sugar-phosphate isomerase [Cypionkella sp.]
MNMTLAHSSLSPALETAAKVLNIEAAALAVLASSLPADFGTVVETILNLKGRVILSGMGKSGHIARKIAATLASTGTPSFFVHPAEASHGDLGMVRPEDFCILLSNSGETPELRDLIEHTRRFGIPLAGMSRDDGSTLMTQCDLRLTIPALAEACPIGMAPTTSTTLMLGLGDALAIALMEARKFQEHEFRAYHPGGKLGAQLAFVSHIMHGAGSLPLVETQSAMSDVILVMSSRGFGVAGVCDADGSLIGVISDGDLRRNMDDLLAKTAVDVCSRNPVSVAPNTLCAEAIAIMNRTKVGALFVCEAGRPVGILHLHDLLRVGVL